MAAALLPVEPKWSPCRLVLLLKASPALKTDSFSVQPVTVLSSSRTRAQCAVHLDS